MRINFGKLLVNRTRKYLYPVITFYGDKFVNIMNGFHKAGIGIGDMILERSGFHYEKHLFILVNVAITYQHGNNFYDMLDVVREHPSYEKDYRYDIKGEYHMIVIRIPEKYTESVEKFRKSKFSKMFNDDEIDRFFRNSNPEIRDILKKNKNYRPEFSKLIMTEFRMKKDEVHPDALTGELDFNIKDKDEKFNYHLVGE